MGGSEKVRVYGPLKPAGSSFVYLTVNAFCVRTLAPAGSYIAILTSGHELKTGSRVPGKLTTSGHIERNHSMFGFVRKYFRDLKETRLQISATRVVVLASGNRKLFMYRSSCTN